MKSLSKLFSAIMRQRPERLWVRFFLGLALIAGVVATTHLYTQSLIVSVRDNATLVNLSGRQRLMSHQILLRANERVNGVPAAEETLARYVTAFSDSHLNLLQETSIIDNTGEPAGPFVEIDPVVRSFIQIAQQLNMAEENAPELLDQLTTLGQGALLEALDQATKTLEIADIRQTDHLWWVQTIGVVVVGSLLILEAIFIFYPAQQSVWRAMQDLEDSATVLKIKSTQLRQANAALNRAASHDALTQLPNRSFLIEQLTDAMEDRKGNLSVLSVDIDRFKAINDSAGQSVGDALLISVGQILSDSVGRNDVVARIGGDEFVVLTRQEPALLAKRLSQNFEKPMHVAGRICQTGLSIGYVTCKRWDRDPLVVLSNADLALQRAKNTGTGQTVVYSRKLREEVAIQDMLSAELPNALAEGQIVPFFQPQIQLSDGQLAGVEVLARWQHPDRGLVPPDVFLTLAEKAGFARDLDYHIWDCALKQSREWKDLGIEVPRISLNAAPDTIADPKVVKQIFAGLANYEIAPRTVAIEVLETTFIDSIFDVAAINIDRLIGAGLIVELDDFGTGYTSLSTLNQLSLSGIKLDRSLISPLPARNAESIVRAVMALAKEMKLHVVAEGIETPEQAEYLTQIGCDVGQGYGIGKPMTADQFTEWLRVWQQEEHPQQLQA